MINFFSRKKKERVRLEPIKETIHPDLHGYTGFSIIYWNTKGFLLPEISCMNRWGGFHPDRIMGDSEQSRDFLLEGRFFVFGSLLKLVLERGNEERILEIHEDLWHKWQPIMDEIKNKESILWNANGRHGTYIDEIIDDDLKIRICDIGYRSWMG